MVIIPCRVGQLGNQLFHIAHFAASAIEHEYRIRFACFQYPLDCFPNLNSDPLIRVSQATVRRNRWQHHLFKILRMSLRASPLHCCLVSEGPPHINTSTPEFVRAARSRAVLCEGFGFRDPDNVNKHHARLANMFRLATSICEEVDRYERERLPKGDAIKVGFHVRRGDYGAYEGGSFLLDDRRWLELIRQTRNHIRGEGKHFTGILFSNEEVRNLIESAEDLTMGPGGIFSDLEMLSRCDLIIAPPSTYSGWASFIGQVPLLRVDSTTTQIDSSRFAIVAW